MKMARFSALAPSINSVRQRAGHFFHELLPKWAGDPSTVLVRC